MIKRLHLLCRDRRGRLVCVAAAVALIAVPVIGVAVSRVRDYAKARERAAQGSVAMFAERFRLAIAHRLSHSDTITGADLMALRRRNMLLPSPVSAHWIGLVGAHRSHSDVVITFEVRAQFGGGVNERTDTRCYQVEFGKVGGQPRSSLTGIACTDLTPAVPETAVLHLGT